MADTGCPDGCTPEDSSFLPLWANLVLAAGLVSLSALFSGLSLGLLSLDKSTLVILSHAGGSKEQVYAKQITPLRANGNLLLCTLVIGNVIVNSFLSILLAGISGGILGLLVSTVLIVLFGEIMPQAICSRYGLYIGAKTRYITWFCITCLYVVAKPISMALDYMLGKEVGTVYSRDELKKLLHMHVTKDSGGEEGVITDEDHNLLAGALDYSNKTVQDVMTPVERVFMLEASTSLDFETMLEIYKSGYTRIPVYEGTRDKVQGVLFVKDLILVDPDDEIEVQTVVSFRGPRHCKYILDTTPLNQVFKIFKASYTHLMVAVAFCDPVSGQRMDTTTMLTNASQFMFQAAQATKEVTGVITLEDILEEVIKDEIVDEFDVHMSNETMDRVKRGRDRPDISAFLSLFEHKVRESAKLSRQEVHAISAFLTARVKDFAVFEGANAQLRQLVTASTVLDVDEESTEDDKDSLDNGEQSIATRVLSASPGDRLGTRRVLYVRGAPSTAFTLVLQGWTVVWAGEEAFESDLGPWSCLGNAALTVDAYTPDYSCVTTGKCRLLRVEAQAYKQAVEAVRASRQYGSPRRNAAGRTSSGGQPPRLRGTPDSDREPDANSLESAIANGTSAPSSARVLAARAQSGAGAASLGPRTLSAIIEHMPAASDIAASGNQAALKLARSDSALRRSLGRDTSGPPAADSGMQGVVMIGERGQPMCIGEDGWRDLAAEHGTPTAARRSKASHGEVELVQVGSEPGVFRALTLAERMTLNEEGQDGESDSFQTDSPGGASLGDTRLLLARGADMV